MLHDFIQYSRQQKLIAEGDRVMLAVSGGLDSIVMTELFRQAGIRFAIAHVNFNLRGRESDRDESFVRKLAADLAVPCFVTHFKTRAYARQKGVSTQVAARELRYAWFETLLTTHGYDSMATAHHLDDQVETFLINLARGTGIAGLKGIPARQGTVVRPMLFATRKQLEAFARLQGLSWVEDSSNTSLAYARNRIRHRIIPQMEKLNPAFRDELLSTISHIRDAEAIYRQAIERERARLVSKEQGYSRISIAGLEGLANGMTYLYEFLAEWGFNASTAKDIWESTQGQPGKTFYSPSHRLVKDREFLIIQPFKIDHGDASNQSFVVPAFEHILEMDHPIRLDFEVMQAKDLVLSPDPLQAFLDYDKVSFPLILRKWRKGDYFIPLGLKGKSKISDFLINLKLSLPQKEGIWLVCSRDEIAWVVGRRIDDRFKVGPATERALSIRFYPVNI